MNMNDTYIGVATKLQSMTKAQVIEVYRSLNCGKVGDTARTGKDEYIKMVCSFPLEQVEQVLSSGSAATATANATQADAVAQLQNALQALLHTPKAELDADAVRALVAEQLTDLHERTLDDNSKLYDHVMQRIEEMRQQLAESVAVTRIELIDASGAIKAIDGAAHECMPKLIRAVKAGVHVMLVGPAGSGKTTACEQAATALGLDFYFNGALDTEYKLKGFVDAQGRIVSTAFRQAFENGGLYLFDEVDASLPGATMAFNAALANGWCDFPDGRIKAHKDFHCVAAANTFGLGATFEFVGRNKQDAAFLDRFAVIRWGIDEKLERQLSPNKAWTEYVQAVRAAVEKKGIKHVISPRASINGAKLLAAGMDLDDVTAATVRKGLTDEQWQSVQCADKLPKA